VAYFLKQLGSMVFSENQKLRFRDSHAGDWSEWPKEARVRQMPKRLLNVVRQDPLPLFTDGDGTQPDKRLPLEVEGDSKARQAALKAWETRRRTQDEQKWSEAALKARKTRKKNERKKRSEAAKKAWRTRRDKERNGAG
jgi:hypothetical protein